MLEKLYPSEWIDSTFSICFEEYYRRGYKGLIFDIDNTLVEHGADADERAIKLFERLKQIGFDICLLSNNKRPRVERFNKDINVNYIFKAQKPYSKNYYVAAMMMRTSINETLCIGDQLLTDIYGANLVGIHTILVNPINPKEEIQIVLKRYIENIILYFYKKKCKKENIVYPMRRRCTNEIKSN